MLAFFVLSSAPPDRPTVLAGAVPYLRGKCLSTITADDLTGKRTAADRALGTAFAPGKFRLYTLPFCRGNDGLMTVFHIVLGDFALVDFHLFLQEIYSEFLLQECGAFVLFIPENAFHRTSLP